MQIKSQTMPDTSKEAETWRDAVRDLCLTGWGNSSDINYTDTLVSLLSGEKYQSCVSHRAEKTQSRLNLIKDIARNNKAYFCVFLCSFLKVQQLGKTICLH